MSSLRYDAPGEVQAVGNHTATVFMMHGLGDSAQGWLPVGMQLKQQLPHIKWIFPNAPTVCDPLAQHMCYGCSCAAQALCALSTVESSALCKIARTRAEANLREHGHAHARLVRHLRARAR